jgi:hypothetical protein
MGQRGRLAMQRTGASSPCVSVRVRERNGESGQSGLTGREQQSSAAVGAGVQRGGAAQGRARQLLRRVQQLSDAGAGSSSPGASLGQMTAAMAPGGPGRRGGAR